MKIMGTRKADSLYGTDDDDVLRGKNGNDRLHGDDGDDKLFGGRGNDGIYGGDGFDTMTGGKGRDTFFLFAGDDITKITDFTPGKDRVIFDNLDGDKFVPGLFDPYPYLSDFAYSGSTLSYLGEPIAIVPGFVLSGDNLLFV